MPSSLDMGADTAWSLYDGKPLDGAFELENPNSPHDQAVVSKVHRPYLFGFQAKKDKSNGRSILILGGGGYIQLMAGREGVQVAQWLTGLGFDAYVLVHRFPNVETGPQAPLEDARRALSLIVEKRGELAAANNGGISICGLSSGGHLGAALLAEYPSAWTSPVLEIPKPEFAIIGYGPISTNAKGRTVVLNKAPLDPPAKQELYNVVQPDVQIATGPPPTFIVYSGNDPVVPVANAYRLAEGITNAGGQVELHVFADAPHGFALDTKDLPVSRWPELCEAWLRQGGFLS
ncbi:Alpha/Beta hydrolase protein [Truncatella angustata]|uniref:Alpha/Beta hydrolase protein n=1 Tax=Truncatella angustata TaxID=152316 RepID=A0A9P9A356_9PEZI|nr:Alpha/Beta hydrolase protein [Truncatella angustata]KAH6658910.1 Alpha/Beta hydrolase protein [Truncatella angustata]KAH8195860.1 hypothetical protein TruAng_009990 [Truncatella angustata]